MGGLKAAPAHLGAPKAWVVGIYDTKHPMMLTRRSPKDLKPGSSNESLYDG